MDDLVSAAKIGPGDPRWEELVNGPMGEWEPTGAALVAAQNVDMSGPRYSLQEVLDEIEDERAGDPQERRVRRLGNTATPTPHDVDEAEALMGVGAMGSDYVAAAAERARRAWEQAKANLRRKR